MDVLKVVAEGDYTLDELEVAIPEPMNWEDDGFCPALDTCVDSEWLTVKSRLRNGLPRYTYCLIAGRVVKAWRTDGSTVAVSSSIVEVPGVNPDDGEDVEGVMDYDVWWSESGEVVVKQWDPGLDEYAYLEVGYSEWEADWEPEASTLNMTFINTTVNVVKKGVPTSYAYDAQGRKVKEVGPGVFHEWLRDESGNEIQHEDGKGRRTVRAYDALERLTISQVWDHTDPSDPVLVHEQRFWYDALGRLTKATDTTPSSIPGPPPVFPVSTDALTTHTIERRYDSLGNVVLESQDGIPLHFTYDGLGNRRTAAYPSGTVLAYSHDELERISGLADAHGALMAWEYLGRDLVESKHRGNGVNTTFTYDQNNDVTGIQHYLAGLDGSYVRFEYGRDGMGRPVNVDAFHHSCDGGPNCVLADSHEYEYDGLGRLTADNREKQSPSDTEENLKWRFDWANNWLSLTGNETNQEGWGDNRAYWVESNQTRTHAEETRVEVLERDVSEYGASSPFRREEIELSYDANGNLVKKEFTFWNGSVPGATTSVLYEWDPLNRLVAFHGAGASVELEYDAQNRRVLKSTTENDTTVHQRFVWDGWNEVAAIQWLGTSVDRPAYRETIYGEGLDDLVAMRLVEYDERVAHDQDWPLGPQNGEPKPILARGVYFLEDAQGSVVQVVSSLGEWHTIIQYDAYGEPKATGNWRNVASGAVWNLTTDGPFQGIGLGLSDDWFPPFLYTGRSWDKEMGLHYLRNRYYDPDLGRFISQDPIGAWGDAANLGNPYAYCGNRPTGCSDPTGEEGTLSGQCFHGTEACNMSWEQRHNGAPDFSRLNEYYGKKMPEGMTLVCDLGFIGGVRVGFATDSTKLNAIVGFGQMILPNCSMELRDTIPSEIETTLEVGAGVGLLGGGCSFAADKGDDGTPDCGVSGGADLGHSSSTIPEVHVMVQWEIPVKKSKSKGNWWEFWK